MENIYHMFRIRFHGRGGQGIKTASRILGSAFFRQGFEVQDAPVYGAERRGAPVFAYVRAAREAMALAKTNSVIRARRQLVAPPFAGKRLVLRAVAAAAERARGSSHRRR